MSKPHVPAPRIDRINPPLAIAGGKIVVQGDGFPVDDAAALAVTIGETSTRPVRLSRRALTLVVPEGISGATTVSVATARSPGLIVAETLATGLHQVDNPAFDRAGNLYVTYSGGRGQQVPVSIFLIRPDGTREPFVSEITNPTAVAFGADGSMFVSSRFEGAVYRVSPDREVTSFATELGIACGLAFGPDGRLYVGDRTGTIFRVDRSGHAEAYATVPGSVAAFHLAFDDRGALYLSSPTLSSRDSIYRVLPGGSVEVFYRGLGRPQGLAFDEHGTLYVAEALAGEGGVYRLAPGGEGERMIAGPSIVGLAFDGRGGLVAATNETVYRLPVGVRGRPLV